MYITEKLNSLAILPKLKEIIDIKLILLLLVIGRWLNRQSACHESSEDESSVPCIPCNSQASMAAAVIPTPKEAKTSNLQDMFAKQTNQNGLTPGSVRDSASTNKASVIKEFIKFRPPKPYIFTPICTHRCTPTNMNTYNARKCTPQIHND